MKLIISCILGELWYKQPIIAGHSDLDQLQRIVATCGPLNDETWPTWRALPGFPDEEGKAWDKVLPEMSIGEILSQERG
jgi:serine/threonine-protein kinase BUR1